MAQILHDHTNKENGASVANGGAVPLDTSTHAATTSMEKSTDTAIDTGSSTVRSDTSPKLEAEPSHGPDAIKAAAPKARSSLKIGLIMLSLCIAVFLAALDVTIITTAAPTITARFNASEADYTWIGSAYLLASAAATPTWGKLSDIWGRKPVLLMANALFFVGSVIAAVSINIKMLLSGRVIQGVAGGGLLILANICISDLFSMRDRGKYFGMIGGVWGLASAVGPVLGGVFTEKVSWRWCFYINLPFDGIAFAIIFFLLDIEIPKTPIFEGLRAIDWAGVIAVSGGTIMFLLGLVYGGVSHPWRSATVICLIVFGLLTLALFFVNEWKLARYPLMPLRLFSDRSNVASLLICFIHGMVFISGAYFLPLYFQTALLASPLLSGVYLFPYVLSLSFGSILTGIFIKKTGKYLPPIYFGVIFMTIGFALLTNIPYTHTWGKIIAYQIIGGLGAGPNFQSPLIALQTRIAPRDIATATALFGFVRNISTAISIVIGGVIFQNRIKAHGPSLAAQLPPDVTARLSQGAIAGSTGSYVQALPEAQKSIITNAYTQSLRTMFIFYAAIAGAGILIMLLIRSTSLSKEHEEYKGGLEVEKQHRREHVAEMQKKKEEKERLKNSKGIVDTEKGTSGQT